MDFGHVHALSLAPPPLGRRRPSNDSTMPDNKGVGWRKKIHGEDADDTPSERSEASTPRRNSKPKLARYTSLFSSFKESSKGPEFDEPWSENAPPPFQLYIDPLDALQSVRSHMINFSTTPIPLQHNSGLFRIFEDYGKVREERAHLEALLQETLEQWKAADKQWGESEGRYKAEIRRLDLLIAHKGTGGMIGLMEARQGSIVDRKPRHRNTVSNNKLAPMYENLSQEQLVNEIKLRSQRVILHRPKSPSEKMIAMSKQFAHTIVDLPVGNPPDEEKKMTLSRKVQSELNLSTMGHTDFSESMTNSINSGFSGSTGDALPDEMIASTSAPLEAVDCDALVALRELGALVARRRGLQVDGFVEGLMILLSNASDADNYSRYPEKRGQQPSSPDTKSGDAGDPSIEESLIPRRTLRKFQSQPKLASNQRPRRHFSFEPGDDQLHELEEVLRSHESQHGDSDSSDTTDSDSQPSTRSRDRAAQLTNSNSPANTLPVDFQRPSKIPSPVQTLGRARRENSASSLQSIPGRPEYDRRDSCSSILTAFQGTSSGSLRLDPKSRSSSIHKLHAAESSLPPKDLQGSLRFHQSAVALAAARAAEKTSGSRSDSSTRRM